MESLWERLGWSESFQGVKDFLAGFECGTDLRSRCRISKPETVTYPPGMDYYPSPNAPAQLLAETRYMDSRGLGVASDRIDGGVRGAGEPDGPDGSPRVGCPASARSNESLDSQDMPSDEREREKARLQRLLKDFAKEAVAGIAVGYVNPSTGRRPPFFLWMDRNLTTLALRPKDGSAAESSVHDFKVVDIVQIYKGHEVYVRAPTLGRDAVGCVGMDLQHGQGSVILHFDDAYDRDKFYTSLQVISLSAGIQHTR